MRWSPPWARRSPGLGKLVARGDHPIMVWRVQNARGEGPYSIDAAGNISGPAEDLHVQTEAQNEMERFARQGGLVWPPTMMATVFMPNPKRDFWPHEWKVLSAEDKRQLRFGFPTKTAARDWFGDRTLAKLKAAGYDLVEVPAGTTFLSRSGRQVLFRPWTGTPERWRSSVRKERERELMAEEGISADEAESWALGEDEDWEESGG